MVCIYIHKYEGVINIGNARHDTAIHFKHLHIFLLLQKLNLH